ncbi:MAG: VWA domain-containing protein [Flavobacteriales bacterium]|nr:VWA domain-containing protein [Flavobacteriales bacterium]
MIEGIEFANKEWLWALLVIPALLAWYVYRYFNFRALVTMPSLDAFSEMGMSLKEKLRHSLLILRLVAISLLILAMTRPQSSSSWQDISTEGIDIILAIDISGSMLAEDFKPNRLEASKEVAVKFIEERPNDRIGLVVYSGESFTQCPLTTDHAVLKNLFLEIKNGMIEDGTAIGMGLATAVNRLKDSEAKSKVIILLTDGSNTTGSIPPLTAAEIAKSFGVRVYTIGVGTNGQAPYPVQTPFGIQYQQMEVKIDEATLQGIADATGGQYFRAVDKKKLEGIYQEIDKMEKSKIEVTEFRKKSEEFFPLVLVALVLLGLEYMLRNTYFKSLV